MRRMAIFQTDLRVGGIQKSLVNILKEIDYREWTVDLYLFDSEGSFFDFPTHENLHIFHLPPMLHSLDRVLYFGIVRALARDVTGGVEYDVAIDFNSYRSECAVGCIKARARRRIMWIHNDVEIKLKNEPKYRVLWHFFKKKFHYFDAFAAVSPGIIDGFRRVTGIWDKPIVSIPNHIDTGEIFRKKDLPCGFSVDPEKVNLCSVGRLCHQKGYDLLLDYFARACRSRKDLRLYLIGDGDDREALEKQAAALGLEGQVEFLGNQPNPFAYMTQMDGFVLTSRYEGQGMVIWEAKALGLPIYISKNLEPYNPGIPGQEDMVQALMGAKKHPEKVCDDLAGYNNAISQAFLELVEGEALVKESVGAGARRGILICGAYGLGNVGDESILGAIIEEMRQVAPEAEITVLTRKPRETAARRGVKAVYTFDLPGVWRAMGKARIYVNGGGSLIQDVTSRRSLWYYLYTLRAAKRRGCKVLMYGCGIGPVSEEKDIRLTREVLNSCVDVITLRDSNSQGELKSMGVTAPKVILAADPTVVLPAAAEETTDQLLAGLGLDPNGRYICFTPRLWPGYEEKVEVFAHAARYAYETYGLTPVFLPIEPKQDSAASRLIAAKLDGVPCQLIPQPSTGYEIIGLLSRMSIVVSMRLHALVFAAGQGVPLVGVVYDQKVSSFLDYVGQDLYVELEKVTAPALEELIDKAAARMGDREFLLSGVERLRSVEGRNSETVGRLWRGEEV